MPRFDDKPIAMLDDCTSWLPSNPDKPSLAIGHINPNSSLASIATWSSSTMEFTERRVETAISWPSKLDRLPLRNRWDSLEPAAGGHLITKQISHLLHKADRISFPAQYIPDLLSSSSSTPSCPFPILKVLGLQWV